MHVDALRDNVNRSMEFNWSEGKWQGKAPTGTTQPALGSAR